MKSIDKLKRKFYMVKSQSVDNRATHLLAWDTCIKQLRWFGLDMGLVVELDVVGTKLMK